VSSSLTNTWLRIFRVFELFAVLESYRDKNAREDKESGRCRTLEIAVLGVKKLYYNSKRTSSDLYTRPVFPGV